MPEEEPFQNTGDTAMLNGMKLSVGQCTGGEIKSAINQAVKSGEIVSHGGLYTTPEMIRIEHDIVKTVIEGANEFKPLMDKDAVSKVISEFQEKKGFSLSDGQADAIKVVLGGDNNISTGRVALISGSAGTGKTTSFEVCYEALKDRNDIELIGLGASGKAGAQLQMDSNIKSQTVASYNIQKNEPVAEGKTRVLIVDEASLLSSRDLGTLNDKERDNHTKIILCGDGAQILSVGSGRIFSDLVKISEEHGVIQHAQITEVQRQKLNAEGTNQYSVDATKAFQNHEVEKGYQLLQDAGKITQVEDREARIQLAAEKYVMANQHDGTLSAKQQIRLASVAVLTNHDRIDMNEAIRDLQKEAGQIGKVDFVYQAERPINLNASAKRFASNYSEGNIAVLTKNMQVGDITLLAGTRFEITATDIQKQTISVDMAGENNSVKVAKEDRVELGRMQAEGEYLSINLKQEAHKISLLEMIETKAALNEKMIFTKGDNTDFGKENSIKNNVVFIITALDHETGKATLETELAKKISDYQLEGSNTTNAGATTAHKQQGATVIHQIAMIDSSSASMQNENINYVLDSRQISELEIITDNTTALIENVKDAQEKTSTVYELDKLDSILNSMLSDVNAKVEQQAEQLIALQEGSEQISEKTAEHALSETMNTTEIISSTEQSTERETHKEDIQQETAREHASEEQSEQNQEVKQEYELSL